MTRNQRRHQGVRSPHLCPDSALAPEELVTFFWECLLLGVGRHSSSCCEMHPVPPMDSMTSSIPSSFPSKDAANPAQSMRKAYVQRTSVWGFHSLYDCGLLTGHMEDTLKVWGSVDKPRPRWLCTLAWSLTHCRSVLNQSARPWK